jgi:phage replication initiation protein
MFDSSSLVPDLPSADNGHPPEIAQYGAAADSTSAECAQARVKDALAASPHRVTTGGNPFPPETLQQPLAALALIDWFAFTIKPPGDCGLSWLFPELVSLFDIREATPTGKGWFGYAERYDLGGYGILAHGGESQRGSIHVELNATGCARVANWLKIMEWGETHRATITRVDLAHDDIDGQTVSIETALQWLRSGEFATNGRPPAAQLIDDLGSGKGKTLYVGSRTNGKLCRVYEKGRQLGDPSSPWVRVEVELRNKSRVIPWDTLINPGHYLAGAYPCLDFLSVIQERIRTITKAVTVSYARAVHHAQQMTGKLVNVMFQVHGGDAFAVVNELKRDGIPRGLKNYTDFLPQIIADVIE